MELEENWLRYIKPLIVLPNFVTLFIFWLSIVSVETLGFNYALLLLLSILSMGAYVMSYLSVTYEYLSNFKIVAWALGFITTAIWLVIFSYFSFFLFQGFEIWAMALGLFIIGYPLIILYFYFRLFMNELSKPYKS